MLIELVGVKDSITARDACITLKNAALENERRLSLSKAGNIYNVLKSGRRVWLEIPHPQLVLKHFLVSHRSIQAIHKARSA